MIISVNKLDIIQYAIQAERDPGCIRSLPRTVANGQTIRLSAVGISNSGNAFSNSSSVPLRWELNDCQELGSWNEAYNSQLTVSSWERYLRLENASGQVLLEYLSLMWWLSFCNFLTISLSLGTIRRMVAFPFPLFLCSLITLFLNLCTWNKNKLKQPADRHTSFDPWSD